MHSDNLKSNFLQMREAALADIGELAGPVTHEINNLLNTLSLHLAIWQQSSPQPLADDLQIIRQKISHVAKVVNLFQQRRLPLGLTAVDVDVNSSLQQAANDVQSIAPGVKIDLQLKPTPLWVKAHEADLRRLCRFLLANAIRSVLPEGPPVIVRSDLDHDQILVEIEDAGPSIPDGALADIFEPAHEARHGMCCLELSACVSIAQRLRGKVQAFARPSEGLILAVRMPSVAPAEKTSNVQKPRATH